MEAQPAGGRAAAFRRRRDGRVALPDCPPRRPCRPRGGGGRSAGRAGQGRSHGSSRERDREEGGRSASGRGSQE